jgi:hypothetical protein
MGVKFVSSTNVSVEGCAENVSERCSEENAYS